MNLWEESENERGPCSEKWNNKWLIINNNNEWLLIINHKWLITDNRFLINNKLSLLKNINPCQKDIWIKIMGIGSISLTMHYYLHRHFMKFISSLFYL